MKRKLKDDTGGSWLVSLLPAERQNEEADEEMLLRFTPQADDAVVCEIRVLGPAQEDLDEIEADELRFALDAARSQIGFLFLDSDDRLWWVQTPDEDPVADGAALTFAHLTDELHHPGPLPAPPVELSEDELQELLDETLGRVIG